MTNYEMCTSDRVAQQTVIAAGLVRLAGASPKELEGIVALRLVIPETT